MQLDVCASAASSLEGAEMQIASLANAPIPLLRILLRCRSSRALPRVLARQGEAGTIMTSSMQSIPIERLHRLAAACGCLVAHSSCWLPLLHATMDPAHLQSGVLVMNCRNHKSSPNGFWVAQPAVAVAPMHAPRPLPSVDPMTGCHRCCARSQTLTIAASVAPP